MDINILIPPSRLSLNVWLFFLYVSVAGSLTASPAGKTTTPTPRGEVEGLLDTKNWTDVSDIPVTDCKGKWTCEGYRDYSRLSTSKRGHYVDKNCACDDLCVLLQDCCPDVRLTQSQTSSSDAAQGSLVNDDGLTAFTVVREGSSMNQLDKSVLKGSADSSSTIFSGGLSPQESDIYTDYDLTIDMFSCVYDQGINDVNYVSVVSRCPEHFEDMVVMELCHNVTEDDMMTRLPVSGTTTRVLYRNMFCAICHKEPFEYWRVGADCSSKTELPFNENSTLAEPLNSTECVISLQPPSDLYQWRPCLPADVTRTCNENFPLDTQLSRQIAARCEEDERGTQRTVFSFTRAYRNQYCALCNYIDITSLNCDGFPVKPSIDRRAHLPYSFSILLDINTNTGSTTVGRRGSQSETVERQEAASCDVGQVFDPFRVTCRPVVCGPGRHFIGSTCVEKDPESRQNIPVSTEKSAINRKSDHIIVLSNCNFIQLNDTEYKLSDDGILEIVGTDTLYNQSQYIIQDNTVFVCVNYSQNYTRTITEKSQTAEFNFSLTEAVISTCGICISLIALVVTIVVYASLPPLRNIPGRNLLSLVCSLFLADLLLLVAPSAGQVFLVCAVMAGVMHYFFLASFVWMNVMAVDVWFTFSKAFVKAGDRGKSSKRFIMYSCYAWLTPVAFVLPAALLQLFSPGSSVSPDYGVGICWLSNKYALLLFFASPLFLLLVLNIVFFLISARNISRAKRTSARMLGKEEEGKMAIYVKLTVVMGITWVLGFLAALVPGNLILTYSFVVMNTLQGLFICLSFVFTKKVLNLLKDKFCGRKKVRISKSGSTDTTNLSKSLSANRKLSSGSAKFLQNVVAV